MSISLLEQKKSDNRGLRSAKEINLEILRMMNLGIDKSNFRLDMGYLA